MVFQLSQQSSLQSPEKNLTNEEYAELAFKAFRKNNFLAFCKYYLPHLFPLKFAKFHKKWAKDIEKARFESIFIGEKSPRDTAKTTIFAQAASIYFIAHDRNEKCWVTQKTGKVSDVIRAVMVELDTNEKLIADFGVFKPKNKKLKWSYEEGGVVEGATDKKNLSIGGCGVRGASIGSRITKLFVDDIHDPDNVSSEYQRNRTIEWVIGAVLPGLVAKGSAFFTNSSYHDDDLLNRYEKLGIKLTYKDHNGNEITREFKIRTLDWIIKDEDGNDTKETIWPERYTYGMLMERKHIMQNDVLFNMQYRNLLQTEEAASFKMGDLRKMINRDLSYSDFITNRQQYSVVLQTWDLAIEEDAQKAQEKDTDYYICLTVGLFPDGKRRAINMFRRRGIPSPEVLDITEAKYHAFRPDTMIVESNGFQSWFAGYLLRFKKYPIDKSITIHKDKSGLKLRTSLLHIAVQGHLWEFPYKTEEDQRITDLIFNELFYFGKLRHDDIVLAMYLLEKFLGNAQQFAAELSSRNENTEYYDQAPEDRVTL